MQDKLTFCAVTTLLHCIFSISKAADSSEIQRFREDSQWVANVVANEHSSGKTASTSSLDETENPNRIASGRKKNTDYFSSYSDDEDHLGPAWENPERKPGFHAEAGRGIARSSPACGPSSSTVDAIKSLVRASARRYGVDPDFALAIVWTESRFDQVRNSPKGARGPMQLMPDTAYLYRVADICDPADNIDGGMRHLRTLLDEFKNPVIAAAAYNAGEQAVYDNGGIPAYPETVRYVASVINRQMGLSFSTKRSETRRNRDNSQEPEQHRDVIGARAPAFVGGVMKF